VGERNEVRMVDGKSELSPHSLRRTFGSDFINRGVRLEVISKLLGHSSTTVTWGLNPPVMHVHSANPVARRRMGQAIASVKRLAVGGADDE
jgi:integrase